MLRAVAFCTRAYVKFKSSGTVSYVIVAAGGSIVIVAGSGQFAQVVAILILAVDDIGSVGGSSHKRHYFTCFRCKGDALFDVLR